VRQAIAAPRAPKAIGPYSPAIRAGHFVFLSGQIPIDPATGALVDGGIAAQTEQVMRNISALLEAAGAGFEHVVRTTVFLADMNEFAAMNESYTKFVVDPPPARSTVQVARLPRDARVEIDAIAVLS
jgi:2-iminobutanoate/2-iminopropanoate deaminase